MGSTSFFSSQNFEYLGDKRAASNLDIDIQIQRANLSDKASWTDIGGILPFIAHFGKILS